MKKKCTVCKEVKEQNEENFSSRSEYKKIGKNNGFRYECRICHNEKQKIYRTNNPEKYRYGKLKCDYGLTKEEYEKILHEQNGVCAICKKAETRKHASGKILSLAVDHDHKTNINRGLLCARCNVAFGHLEESVDIIQGMLDYKRKHTAFTWKWINHK